MYKHLLEIQKWNHQVCVDTFLSEEYKLSLTVQGVAQLGPWEGNGGGGIEKKYLFHLFLQNTW